MNKKTVSYILIALLAVLLALFVGLFLGNKNSTPNTNNNGGYIPPAIEDNRGDSVYNPDLGTVEDDENYTDTEVYYIKSNNISSENLEYFINYNGLSADSDTVYMPYLIGMFNATYATDLSSSSFITVERLLGDAEHSNLVYIKFSTYLGKYDGNNLVSTVPALVMFGFEQTINNDYFLRYAFCTYGDRGEVYSDFAFLNSPRNEITATLKMRVPYLLTSNYEEVTQLLTMSGLLKDGYTYKLLNSQSEQYYIKSNVLSVVSNLTKNLISRHISIEPGKGIINNIDLTNYFEVNSVDYDYILSDYSYVNSSFLFDSNVFDYYKDYTHTGFTYYSLYYWFNNNNSIYNIPLVNVEV